MCTGITFDIKEFALLDGPGIRTTVFLKGCPLRCPWCHNPEGLLPEPQILHGAGGDRMVGQEHTAAELAALLNRQIPILASNEGGITFSGGEPLMQADFLLAVLRHLDPVHVLLDTSGYGDAALFAQVVAAVDHVYFDLKIMDAVLHRRVVGADNQLILANLDLLATSGTPFTIRIPLVPGVTDTEANLDLLAAHIASLSAHPPIQLLPYNRAAGGKYAACGAAFHPEYDEAQPGKPRLALFHAHHLEATVA
ncbi:MAG: radical SAM protein [Victivallales bacterium]|nr:radical SAM protein [Victivallales bacterium]